MRNNSGIWQTKQMTRILLLICNEIEILLLEWVTWSYKLIELRATVIVNVKRGFGGTIACVNLFLIIWPCWMMASQIIIFFLW